MQVDDHNLYHEFPEYEGKIRELVNLDTGFARLAGDYHSIDAEIRSLEERDIPTSDFYFEDLKKRRALLKDQVYTILCDGMATRNPGGRALR